jgi:hypothetical protein
MNKNKMFNLKFRGIFMKADEDNRNQNIQELVLLLINNRSFTKFLSGFVSGTTADMRYRIEKLEAKNDAVVVQNNTENKEMNEKMPNIESKTYQ